MVLTCSAQTAAVWQLGAMDLRGCLSSAREV